VCGVCDGQTVLTLREPEDKKVRRNKIRAFFYPRELKLCRSLLNRVQGKDF